MKLKKPVDLDDPSKIAQVDTADMLGVVEGWAEQWADARGPAAAIPQISGPVESLVVCGMGGSGIAGDVVRGLLEPTLPIPMRLVRGHQIPGFVNARSLVACLSYSGNTSETLACFDEAAARGARLVVIASGGLLAERARQAGAILMTPAPGLMPRAALPSLVVPLVVAAGAAGLVDPLPILDTGEAVARRCVERWRHDVPFERNKAKRLAVTIGDHLPIVWGSEGTQTVAAMRWKNQFAENTKLPAIAAMLPELCHNDIVGLHHGHPALSDAILLALRIQEGHPGQEARLKAAVEIAGPSVAAVEMVTIESPTPAERLIESMILADFVSVYLAILRNVDPTPIQAITMLKAALQ